MKENLKKSLQWKKILYLSHDFYFILLYLYTYYGVITKKTIFVVVK